MSEEKRIYVYREQNVEELDRETLIKALKLAIDTIEGERKWNRAVHETNMAFIKARMG